MRFSPPQGSAVHSQAGLLNSKPLAGDSLANSLQCTTARGTRTTSEAFGAFSSSEAYTGNLETSALLTCVLQERDIPTAFPCPLPPAPSAENRNKPKPKPKPTNAKVETQLFTHYSKEKGVCWSYISYSSLIPVQLGFPWCYVDISAGWLRTVLPLHTGYRDMCRRNRNRLLPALERMGYLENWDRLFPRAWEDRGKGGWLSPVGRFGFLWIEEKRKKEAKSKKKQK